MEKHFAVINVHESKTLDELIDINLFAIGEQLKKNKEFPLMLISKKAELTPDGGLMFINNGKYSEIASEPGKDRRTEILLSLIANDRSV